MNIYEIPRQKKNKNKILPTVIGKKESVLCQAEAGTPCSDEACLAHRLVALLKIRCWCFVDTQCYIVQPIWVVCGRVLHKMRQTTVWAEVHGSVWEKLCLSETYSNTKRCGGVCGASSGHRFLFMPASDRASSFWDSYSQRAEYRGLGEAETPSMSLDIPWKP